MNALRENQNTNKTLRSLFASQFLGKLSYEELEGLQKSIEKHLNKKSSATIQNEIAFLERHGYKVGKK